MKHSAGLTIRWDGSAYHLRPVREWRQPEAEPLEMLEYDPASGTLVRYEYSDRGMWTRLRKVAGPAPAASAAPPLLPPRRAPAQTLTAAATALRPGDSPKTAH